MVCDSISLSTSTIGLSNGGILYVMLNPFPIQFLALAAYAVLRIIVGFVLIYLGVVHSKNRAALAPVLSLPFFPYGKFSAWLLAVVEIALGVMFVAGFLTQVAALLSMFLSLTFIILRSRWPHPLIPGRLFYILLFGCSCSLFVTGAGIFAFDLPL